MKRTIQSLAVAAALLMTSAVFAQTPPGPGQPPGPGGGPRMDVLVGFLGLDEAQQTQWQTLHQQFAENIQPLLEQRRDLQSQLRALVESESPDPTQIGILVLAVRQVSEQIRTAHEALETSLKAILTADQLLRYEAFQAARKAMGPGPDGPGPGPGGPGGQHGPGGGQSLNGGARCPNC